MRIKKFLIGTLVIGIGALLLFTDRKKLYRFVVYNLSNITDYEIFPNRPLKASALPFQFNKDDDMSSIPSDILPNVPNFEEFLKETKTVACLIIRNDSILYEKYFDDYNKESIVASFSMAKSVTSLLIGAAIEDGKIGATDDLVIKYLPEMAKQGMEQVTIEHLLQMTSGLDFNESYYNPFGEAASFYYGVNLKKQTEQLTLKAMPGTQFEYTSGNTQLLGMILDRVLAPMTITEYLQNKLWTPLQMEFDASWSIDQEEQGIEKTFCCLNARAIDFAKIGRLMLNKGNWNGTQLINTSWIERSTKPDTSQGGVDHYKYQWWLPSPAGDFVAQGHLGQYIYVHPAKHLIIVRLGHSKSGYEWKDIFVSMAARL